MNIGLATKISEKFFPSGKPSALIESTQKRNPLEVKKYLDSHLSNLQGTYEKSNKERELTTILEYQPHKSRPNTVIKNLENLPPIDFSRSNSLKANNETTERPGSVSPIPIFPKSGLRFASEKKWKANYQSIERAGHSKHSSLPKNDEIKSNNFTSTSENIKLSVSELKIKSDFSNPKNVSGKYPLNSDPNPKTSSQLDSKQILNNLANKINDPHKSQNSTAISNKQSSSFKNSSINRQLEKIYSNHKQLDKQLKSINSSLQLNLPKIRSEKIFSMQSSNIIKKNDLVRDLSKDINAKPLTDSYQTTFSPTKISSDKIQKRQGSLSAGSGARQYLNDLKIKSEIFSNYDKYAKKIKSPVTENNKIKPESQILIDKINNQLNLERKENILKAPQKKTVKLVTPITSKTLGLATASQLKRSDKIRNRKPTGFSKINHQKIQQQLEEISSSRIMEYSSIKVSKSNELLGKSKENSKNISKNNPRTKVENKKNGNDVFADNEIKKSFQIAANDIKKLHQMIDSSVQKLKQSANFEIKNSYTDPSLNPHRNNTYNNIEKLHQSALSRIKADDRNENHNLDMNGLSSVKSSSKPLSRPKSVAIPISNVSRSKIESTGYKNYLLSLESKNERLNKIISPIPSALKVGQHIKKDLAPKNNTAQTFLPYTKSQINIDKKPKVEQKTALLSKENSALLNKTVISNQNNISSFKTASLQKSYSIGHISPLANTNQIKVTDNFNKVTNNKKNLYCNYLPSVKYDGKKNLSHSHKTPNINVENSFAQKSFKGKEMPEKPAINGPSNRYLSPNHETKLNSLIKKVSQENFKDKPGLNDSDKLDFLIKKNRDANETSTKKQVVTENSTRTRLNLTNQDLAIPSKHKNLNIPSSHKNSTANHKLTNEKDYDTFKINNTRCMGTNWNNDLAYRPKNHTNLIDSFNIKDFAGIDIIKDKKLTRTLSSKLILNKEKHLDKPSSVSKIDEDLLKKVLEKKRSNTNVSNETKLPRMDFNARRHISNLSNIDSIYKSQNNKRILMNEPNLQSVAKRQSVIKPLDKSPEMQFNINKGPLTASFNDSPQKLQKKRSKSYMDQLMIQAQPRSISKDFNISKLHERMDCIMNNGPSTMSPGVVPRKIQTEQRSIVQKDDAIKSREKSQKAKSKEPSTTPLKVKPKDLSKKETQIKQTLVHPNVQQGNISKSPERLPRNYNSSPIRSPGMKVRDPITMSFAHSPYKPQIDESKIQPKVAETRHVPKQPNILKSAEKRPTKNLVREPLMPLNVLPSKMHREKYKTQMILPDTIESPSKSPRIDMKLVRGFPPKPMVSSPFKSKKESGIQGKQPEPQKKANVDHISKKKNVFTDKTAKIVNKVTVNNVPLQKKALFENQANDICYLAKGDHALKKKFSKDLQNYKFNHGESHEFSPNPPLGDILAKLKNVFKGNVNYFLKDDEDFLPAPKRLTKLNEVDKRKSMHENVLNYLADKTHYDFKETAKNFPNKFSSPYPSPGALAHKKLNKTKLNSCNLKLADKTKLSALQPTEAQQTRATELQHKTTADRQPETTFPEMDNDSAQDAFISNLHKIFKASSNGLYNPKSHCSDETSLVKTEPEKGKLKNQGEQDKKVKTTTERFAKEDENSSSSKEKGASSTKREVEQLEPPHPDEAQTGLKETLSKTSVNLRKCFEDLFANSKFEDQAKHVEKTPLKNSFGNLMPSSYWQNMKTILANDETSEQIKAMLERKLSKPSQDDIEIILSEKPSVKGRKKSPASEAEKNEKNEGTEQEQSKQEECPNTEPIQPNYYGAEQGPGKPPVFAQISKNNSGQVQHIKQHIVLRPTYPNDCNQYSEIEEQRYPVKQSNMPSYEIVVNCENILPFRSDKKKHRKLLQVPQPNNCCEKQGNEVPRKIKQIAKQSQLNSQPTKPDPNISQSQLHQNTTFFNEPCLGNYFDCTGINKPCHNYLQHRQNQPQQPLQNLQCPEGRQEGGGGGRLPTHLPPFHFSHPQPQRQQQEQQQPQQGIPNQFMAQYARQQSMQIPNQLEQLPFQHQQQQRNPSFIPQINIQRESQCCDSSQHYQHHQPQPQQEQQRQRKPQMSCNTCESQPPQTREKTNCNKQSVVPEIQIVDSSCYLTNAPWFNDGKVNVKPASRILPNQLNLYPLGCSPNQYLREVNQNQVSKSNVPMPNPTIPYPPPKEIHVLTRCKHQPKPEMMMNQDLRQILTYRWQGIERANQ